MKNKELISMQEIQASKVVFDTGMCYNVQGMIFTKEQYTAEIKHKISAHNRISIGTGGSDNQDAMVIYRYINADFVMAVEECRSKAVKTTCFVNDIRQALEVEGCDIVDIITSIEGYLSQFNKVKF